jgi:hypothetical protein
MTNTTASPHPRRPVLGAIAQVLGIAGAIVCALAIAGVLLGQSWAKDRLDALAQDVVEALDRAVGVSEDALAGIAAGIEEADGIGTAAQTLASAPTIDEAAMQALIARVAPLAERYQAIRDRYVVLRERATTFMEVARRVDQLIPGITLPEGPVEPLARVDQGLANLDQALVDLTTKALDRAAASEAAAAIATAAGSLESGLTDAQALAQEIHDDLVSAQADVEALADRLESLVGVSALAIGAVLAWILVLHLALFTLGRHWRRD